MRIVHFLAIVAIAASNVGVSAADKYALENAPCFKGPNKQSGRYFFTSTAKAPMTLDKGGRYNVVEEQGAWSRVVLFSSSPDKTAWIESRLLATSLDSKTTADKTIERLKSFDELNKTGNWKALYIGAAQRGTRVTISVTDVWNQSSKDIRSAFVQNMTKLFFSMGGARSLPEDPKEFHFDIRHAQSGRIVATWDGVRGTSLKD